MKFIILITLVLYFSSNLYADSSVTTKDVQIVEKNISLKVSPSKTHCEAGQIFTGGTTQVSCVFEFGITPSAGLFTNRAFDVDPYFDTEVKIMNGKIIFNFYAVEIDPQELLSEVIDYYTQNEINYEITYVGPDFDLSEIGK